MRSDFREFMLREIGEIKRRLDKLEKALSGSL